MSTHHDFEAQPEEARWTKSLAELGVVLKEEAWKAKGPWRWRVLPHGAFVGMRIREDFRRELRIARRGKPADEAARAKWRNEVKVFLAHLGCTAWALREADAEGKAVVYAVEIFDGEPNEAKCALCGAPVVHDARFKEDLCVACAIRKGREEAERNNARRHIQSGPGAPAGSVGAAPAGPLEPADREGNGHLREHGADAPAGAVPPHGSPEPHGAGRQGRGAVDG